MTVLLLSHSNSNPTFPAPDTIAVDKAQAQRVFEKAQPLLEHAELPISSIELDLDAIGISDDVFLMGWEPLRFSVSKQSLYLYLEDVNGVALYYHVKMTGGE